MTTTSQFDPTSGVAIGPTQAGMPLKSSTTYTESGLPTPPAGWGRKLGMDPSEAPDTICQC